MLLLLLVQFGFLSIVSSFFIDCLQFLSEIIITDQIQCCQCRISLQRFAQQFRPFWSNIIPCSVCILKTRTRLIFISLQLKYRPVSVVFVLNTSLNDWAPSVPILFPLITVMFYSPIQSSFSDLITF